MTGSGDSATPFGAWILLGVALLAVSSAGAVLQAMGEIPAYPARFMANAGYCARASARIRLPIQENGP